MPRNTRHNPDDPVPRDSKQLLWNCIAEGLIDPESDVTASGHVRSDINEDLPAPSPTNWAADVQTSSPFGQQTRPNVFTTPERKNRDPPDPPNPPPAPRKKPVLAEMPNGVSERTLCLEIEEMEFHQEKTRVALGMLDRIIEIAGQLHTPGSYGNKENC